MRKLLPFVFLALAAPAFAGSVISKAKTTIASKIGIRATSTTTELTTPGDQTTYEVVSPDKLGNYGLTGLKAGNSITVKLVGDGVIEVIAVNHSVRLAVDANGGVSLAK